MKKMISKVHIIHLQQFLISEHINQKQQEKLSSWNFQMHQDFHDKNY